MDSKELFNEDGVGISLHKVMEWAETHPHEHDAVLFLREYGEYIRLSTAFVNATVQHGYTAPETLAACQASKTKGADLARTMIKLVLSQRRTEGATR